MFNLKKLSEVEGKEKYHVEVSNRFAALEDLHTEVEINSAWAAIRENIKTLAIDCIGCEGSISYGSMKDTQNC
jgi:hypothetical protein